MSLADKFANWIGDLGDRFKKTVGDWSSGILAWGIEVFFDVLGKAFVPKLKPIIKTIEDSGEVPPELQPILDELKNPTGQAASMLGSAFGHTFIGGALGQIMDALFRPLGYYMNRLRPNLAPNLTQLMSLWLRGHVKEEDMKFFMTSLGYNEGFIPPFKDLSQIRLDPASVITAWRRNPEEYEKLFEDLRQQGWTDDRIEALKFFSLVYPSPRDLVEFQAHEVFEPDMVEKYGLADETETLQRDRFHQIGMSDEIIDEYWRNHWQHASWGQVLDMYHRGVITKDDIWQWFKLVEIPPYWRDKLIEISWSLPNRIETRMMARYGIVDKTWLVEHLERIGLHEDYRSIAADFMLAMGIRMDISSRYSKGWLNSDEVKSEIAEYGLSEEIGERLYSWIVKNVEGDRVEGERDITKTDILNGVKKGIITWEEGKELLQDMGYDDLEAEYLLEIKVGTAEATPVIVKQRDLTKTDILAAIKKEIVSISEGRQMLIDLGYSAGEADILIMSKLGVTDLNELGATIVGASPASYIDFKRRTQKYKQVSGLEAKLPPAELLEAERALKEAEIALKEAKAEGVKDEKLAPYEKAVSDASYRYKQLLTQWQKKS